MSAESVLQRQMAQTARAFLEHATYDPDFQVGLIAASNRFGAGRSNGHWVAHHWIGRHGDNPGEGTITNRELPESVDLSRVLGAVISHDSEHNLVYWYVGKRPGDQKVELKMYAVKEEESLLENPHAWATRVIAGYAAESHSESRLAASKRNWLSRLFRRGRD